MMSCPSEDMLAELVSGRLLRASARAVYQHLEGCPSCQQLLSLLLTSATSLASDEVSPDGPTDLDMGLEPRTAQGSDEEMPQRFEVLRCLGMGGMGAVFEVFDRRHGRRVALKSIGGMQSLEAQRIDSPTSAAAVRGELVDRFKREFRSLQALSHPNLISLGELLEEKGRWLIVMELIDGVDLLTYVRNGAAPDLSVDEQRLRRTLLQLAIGLCAIHAAGIVHRDVKPANALVTREGRVVLLDFGLVADRAADLDDEDKIVGSLAYMAPEQASLQPVGPAADWYAVGVLLYQMLTGRLPIEGAPRDVLREKSLRTPPRPQTLRLEISDELDALCMELLRIDPAARPSGADVLRRLGGSQAAMPVPSLRCEPFVGRDAELRQLEQAARAGRAGTGGLVIVRGASGVGKSALVEKFVAELSQQQPDTLILTGHCYEREAIPYKALDGVIDALSRVLRRLPRDEVEPLLPDQASLLSQIFPVLARVASIAEAPVGPSILEPHEQAARAFAALRTLLGRLTERQPMVLIIDDLQWADADSLALIQALRRGPKAPPLLIVATWRDDAQTAATATATAEPLAGARIVEITPLVEAEARELVRLLSGDAGIPQLDDATHIAAEAGGHPLFIRELVRHSMETTGPTERRGLEDVLRGRVDRLDAAERSVLEFVALSPGPLDEDLAERAAELLPGAFWRALTALRGAALLRTAAADVDALEPYHDRVRAAVLSAIVPAIERTRHRQLAETLLAAGRIDPEPLAHHFEGAGELERAMPYTVAAAERASSALAFDRASALYRKALSLRPDAANEPTLRIRLGESLANAGRGAESAAEYQRALPLVSTAQGLELRERIAEQQLRCGHTEAGLAVFEDILRGVGVTLPRTRAQGLAWLLYERLRLHLRGFAHHETPESDCDPRALHVLDALHIVANGLMSVDAVLRTALISRLLRLSLDVGEPRRVAYHLASESFIRSWSAGRKGREQSRTLLEKARSMAGRIDDPDLEALFFIADAELSSVEERWADSRRCFERGLEILASRCVGKALEMATLRLVTAQMLAALGELRVLTERAPGWLADAERRGDLHAIACASVGFSNLAWLVRDDPEGARRVASRAAEHLRSRAGFFLFKELLAQLHVDLYVGDGAAARARLRARWPERFMMRFSLFRIFCHELRGRAALSQALSISSLDSQRQQLLAEAAEDARHLRREGSQWPLALAELLEAGIASAEANHGHAAALYRAAITRFLSLDMNLHAAIARRRLGELLCAHTDHPEGPFLVGKADKWLAGQGIRAAEKWAQLIAPAGTFPS